MILLVLILKNLIRIRNENNKRLDLQEKHIFYSLYCIIFKFICAVIHAEF